MNDLANFTPIPITGDYKIVWPDDIEPEKWAKNHSMLVAIKRKAKQLIVESYEFGVSKFGEEYAGNVHDQSELALGFKNQEPKPNINGEGKAKGFISVEGISQEFSIWQRSVAHLIPTWDRDRLTRALELLEPMERQAQAIRARLGA